MVSPPPPRVLLPLCASPPLPSGNPRTKRGGGEIFVYIGKLGRDPVWVSQRSFSVPEVRNFEQDWRHRVARGIAGQDRLLRVYLLLPPPPLQLVRSQSRGCTGGGTEPVSFPFLSSSSVALTRGGIKNLKLQLGAVWDRAAGAGSEVYIPRRPPSILVCLSPNVDFGGGARIEESLEMKVRQKVLLMRDKYILGRQEL